MDHPGDLHCPADAIVPRLLSDIDSDKAVDFAGIGQLHRDGPGNLTCTDAVLARPAVAGPI